MPRSLLRIIVTARRGIALNCAKLVYFDTISHPSGMVEAYHFISHIFIILCFINLIRAQSLTFISEFTMTLIVGDRKLKPLLL